MGKPNVDGPRPTRAISLAPDFCPGSEPQCILDTRIDMCLQELFLFVLPSFNRRTMWRDCSHFISMFTEHCEQPESIMILVNLRNDDEA
jgi:hypothetical protein